MVLQTLQLGDLTGARKRKSRFRSSRFQDKSEVQSSVNKVKNLVRAIRKDGLTVSGLQVSGQVIAQVLLGATLLN